ncbi:hypothetical protein [Azohydromonas sediminis]|uniref:hypothetical protein n=1 Tax=Azohydromonas sediminis TaxID=2259674 RepID=UPI0013C30F47|nr:hypothetical protein [Azohydromonas sediminis]
MTSHDPLVRLWRLMTHVNIGAALGMVAWLAWSGWQVVTGQNPTMRHDPNTARALDLAHGVVTDGRFLLLRSDAGAAPCHGQAAKTTDAAGLDVKETDL